MNPGYPCPGYGGCGWDAYASGAGGGNPTANIHPQNPNPTGGNSGRTNVKPNAVRNAARAHYQLQVTNSEANLRKEREDEINREIENCVFRKQTMAIQNRSNYVNGMAGRIGRSGITGAAVGAAGGFFIFGAAGGGIGGIPGAVIGVIFGTAGGLMNGVMWEGARQLLYDKYIYEPAMNNAASDCYKEILGYKMY